MPMIDVYAATGTFKAKHELARDLAAAVMRWEQVPPISLFKNNTAAFIHDFSPSRIRCRTFPATRDYVLRPGPPPPVGVLDRVGSSVW